MSASTKQGNTDEKKVDADDNEVQQILRKTVGTVEVLVEVNNNSEKDEEEGIHFIVVRYTRIDLDHGKHIFFKNGTLATQGILLHGAYRLIVRYIRIDQAMIMIVTY